MTICLGNTFSPFIDRCLRGEYGGNCPVKNIVYLGCGLKLNGFSVGFVDRLGQFMELASYAYIYIRIYNINRLVTSIYNITCVFTSICSKLMEFLLLVARSGVYIWVPYSDDNPVPWFDPFLELTTTIYPGYLLRWYTHSLIWSFLYLTTTIVLFGPVRAEYPEVTFSPL